MTMLAQFSATGGGGPATYIEDVFSTYLYTGTSPTNQTINNGIDLDGKGGMVWTKTRNAANSNTVWDTARGARNLLITNQTAANLNIPVTYPAYADYGLQSFNTNGFTLGKDWEGENSNGTTEVSWTFRKQPKFFDVVTYTGNGSQPRAISHNLGSTPGCMIVKITSSTGSWYVYHRGAAASGFTAPQCYMNLNNTNAVTDNAFIWGDTAPTSTTFTVSTQLNSNGVTYVAYLFAHDAGGFGLTGTDNVISCGSFTGLATVNLGYEPQWILYKTSGSANSGWLMVDNMRGFTSGDADPYLEANSSAAETGGNDLLTITSTGFKNNLFASDTFIYIAIRRGPMKVPTDGTKVFSPAVSSASQGTKITTNFPVDMQWLFYRAGGSSVRVDDRLRGVNTTTTAGTISTPYLQTASTSAETSYTGDTLGWDNTGFQMPSGWAGNAMSFNNFRRAPSFFDEVCYTGTGANQTIAHNLGVAPELMIVKSRSNGALGWYVYSTGLGPTKCNQLNQDAGQFTSSTFWNDTAPTASVFSLGSGGTNGSGNTQVAYLFSTCAGVSKVGSYTGTGTTQQINCGFTAGARFIMIKRTDSTGDWYVYDSARGIVAGNDPYLLLNSTAAEVTSTDYVDTYAAGFELSSTAPAALNASGGTFIFLAIA